MQEQKPAGGGSEQPHEVHIQNREKMLIQGVLHVESFNDHEIVLDTDLGILTMQGSDLHIRQLDLDKGSFAVEGLIVSLAYAVSGSKQRDRGKGLLERLLR